MGQGGPGCLGGHLERDRSECKLNEVDPCARDLWRSSVRSAMRAASQLPGSPLMWI